MARVDDPKVRSHKQTILCSLCVPFFFVNFDASAYRNVSRSFGAESAFKRELPFVERGVPREVLPYLKRTLNLVDAKVLPIEEAPAQVEAGKARYSRIISER